MFRQWTQGVLTTLIAPLVAIVALQSAAFGLHAGAHQRLAAVHATQEMVQLELDQEGALCGLCHLQSSGFAWGPAPQSPERLDDFDLLTAVTQGSAPAAAPLGLPGARAPPSVA